MKIAINGFGRIGRALYRILCEFTDLYCVNINEPFATIEDISYFLKYDSQYGRFLGNVEIIDENTLKISHKFHSLFTHISHCENVAEFCEMLDEDVYVIEACGKPENALYYRDHINRKAVFTLSSSDIPVEIILGVNEDNIVNNSSNIISGSICDSVALAPVLRAVYDGSNVKQTIITTMHPALSYQNVIDNYTKKGIDRSLGRQYIHSIIPKHTSAQNVLEKIFVDRTIKCSSFRVPTEAVCAAVIVFISDMPISLDNIIDNLKRKKEILFCYENLVSIDFKACKASAVVDMRGIEIIDNSILRMTIWYDNEYGYSSRIIDLLKLWDELIRRKNGENRNTK